MSGREFAFNPSVTRSRVRACPAVRPREELLGGRPSHAARPDARFLIETIESAAASISARDDRIRQLEEHQVEVQHLVLQMRTKLGEIVRLQETTEARAEAEAERAARAESKAARLETRVCELENDLAAATTDLHRIADVITGSFALPTDQGSKASMQNRKRLHRESLNELSYKLSR